MASAPSLRGVPFVHQLDRRGDRPAVLTPDGSAITYRKLAERVAATTERLGTARRLVAIAAANDLDTLVAYLACLQGAHPVLLTTADELDALVTSYDPDVVIGGSSEWDERRAASAHTLHPELAVLLSTSGSTGSPKLVRLSAANLQANAAAIAEYLDIRDTDRAAVSLPIHYCYGLSIVNSNLLRGGAVLLTGDSVIDPRFWSFFQRHEGTSLHGVPYTFELLDRVGFRDMSLPSLRYVTQAGGRLARQVVRRYAELGERRGWRLFVMYGQTEATARMAYLPPELASSHPGAIGVPVPGGRFEIRSTGDADEGELIYHGPNVMLGYASDPTHLALGRTVGALATGDIGRRTPDGLYEVTGRESRFIKPFGKRVDLDFLERSLREAGHPAACTGDDELLIVGVGAAHEVDTVRDLVTAKVGLPRRCVRVCAVGEFPRLPNGKIDYRAIAHHGHNPPATTPVDRSVREAFATALNCRNVADDDTFVGLGGDSLSYVQVSITLERALGHLPANWHLTPVRGLENLRPRTSLFTTVETDIVLRALAITFVVGTHVGLFRLLGGAHLLLAIAGWNFARFALPRTDNPARHLLRSVARIAVPAVLWIGWRAAAQPDVVIANAILINNYLRQGATGYWYIEVLVQALLVLAAVLAIPAVRRFEQRHHFGFAVIVLAVAATARLLVDDTSSFPERVMSLQGTLWFFALGWLAQRAVTSRQKLTVLGAALLLISDYFGDPRREALIIGGVFLLVLLPRVPLPRLLARTAGLLAGSSLYIYLTHYAVYPVLLAYLPPIAVVVTTLAAGLACWQAVQGLARRWGQFANGARPRLTRQ